MAALKLITFQITLVSRISLSKASACTHQLPYSHAEIAALKLITFCVTLVSRISLS